MRRLAAVWTVAFVLLLLPACGLACNDQGWTNTLDVRFEGEMAQRISDVELCFDDTCIRPDADESQSPNGSVTVSEDGEWTFSMFIDAPSRVMISAIDASGREVIEAQRHDVQWIPTWEPNGPGCDNSSVSQLLVVR